MRSKIVERNLKLYIGRAPYNSKAVSLYRCRVQLDPRPEEVGYIASIGSIDRGPSESIDCRAW